MKNNKERTYLFSYSGNKDREVIDIYNNLPILDNITTIIEPFGGSFALIRYLINEKQLNKKFIVNDIDKKLIDIYKEMKEEEINKKILLEIKEHMINITKDKYNKIIKQKNNTAYLLKNILYCIRPGLFPPINRPKNINYNRLENFIIYKNVEFINIDAFKIIEKYKDDETIFLFLDPPYFMSCNDYYIKALEDKYLTLLQNINDYKCKIMACINNHILIESFIKNFDIKIKFHTYIKYSRSLDKSLKEHIYICNY